MLDTHTHMHTAHHIKIDWRSFLAKISTHFISRSLEQTYVRTYVRIADRAHSHFVLIHTNYCPCPVVRPPLPRDGHLAGTGWSAVFRAARCCGGRILSHCRSRGWPWGRAGRVPRGAGGAAGGAASWRWPGPGWRGPPRPSARSRGSPGSRRPAGRVAASGSPL